MATKEDFFEDLAAALDSWVASALSALTQPDGDLEWVDSKLSFARLREVLLANSIDETDLSPVFSECLRGFANSFLTILDGGTQLAEHGRVYVVDEDNNRLGEGLHEEFISYLIDSGRLR